MSIEYCSNIRKVVSPKGETQWCGAPKGKASDQGCNGYSDACPPKLRKYFISDRNIPLDQVTFIAPKIEILGDFP